MARIDDHCRIGSLEIIIGCILNPKQRSLPHRQLRKQRTSLRATFARSLPHRQLRKVSDRSSQFDIGSLPHRQLRKLQSREGKLYLYDHCRIGSLENR